MKFPNSCLCLSFLSCFGVYSLKDNSNNVSNDSDKGGVFGELGFANSNNSGKDSELTTFPQDTHVNDGNQNVGNQNARTSVFVTNAPFDLGLGDARSETPPPPPPPRSKTEQQSSGIFEVTSTYDNLSDNPTQLFQMPVKTLGQNHEGFDNSPPPSPPPPVNEFGDFDRTDSLPPPPPPPRKPRPQSSEFLPQNEIQPSQYFYNLPVPTTSQGEVFLGGDVQTNPQFPSGVIMATSKSNIQGGALNEWLGEGNIASAQLVLTDRKEDSRYPGGYATIDLPSGNNSGNDDSLSLGKPLVNLFSQGLRNGTKLDEVLGGDKQTHSKEKLENLRSYNNFNSHSPSSSPEGSAIQPLAKNELWV